MSYNKYNAKKTVVDDVRFDSMKEARRYGQLKAMEKARAISDLELQPRFLLQEAFECDGKRERKIEYVADFRYRDKGGNVIVEDVKGQRTPVYKVKRKLFLYRYGNELTFREI